ncbi:MAG: type II secretion system F family protein [Endomicrobiaceae bacterium]|nr:type II secretion system F family protein [Endomicrobiaceae bacterium]
MYLVIAVLCLIVFFVIIFNYLFKELSNIITIKQVYTVKSNDDKYFILSLFLNLSKSLGNFFPKIKLKVIDDYSGKINEMIKTLDDPYTRLNGYSLLHLQIISAITGFFLAYIIAGFDILIIFCSIVLFFILPYIKILETYKKKKNSIIKQLPNLADLLTVMIGSGIDFNNSLIKISSILNGDLAKEIVVVNSKVSLGIHMQQALNEMAQKYNIVQLDLFVKTINSALNSGLGISDSLNKLSEQLKLENASIAEKKAQEAPVKMLIPMVLLIFPTIFILLFAPIIISFMTSGGL